MLVGKLPLPTDQIELITLALIYKFMDDLDEESVRVGGKPSFFVGPLEKYRWRALLSQTVSADERMNLFAEGIEAIPGALKRAPGTMWSSATDHPILQVPSFGGAIVSRSSFGPGTAPRAS